MPATTRQAERLRRDLLTLTTLAGADLRAAWRKFDTADAARDGLRDLLPQLIETYGTAAGTLAADWYDDLRDQVGARGRFQAIVAELGDDGDLGTDELAGWATGPLYAATPDWESALSLTEGGTSRRILNVSRQTISASSVADPAARGWQRVGAGGCDFCAMLIGRGAVYSEATASFESHDHCRCAAEPVFA